MYVDEYKKISLKTKILTDFRYNVKKCVIVFNLLGPLINYRLIELTLSFKDFATISMSYTMCVEYDFAP